MLGRVRAWRELGGKLREIGGTIRGRTEVLGRFREELEHRQRWKRISLGKAHSEAVRKIESLAGEVYRGGMEGAEGRAREATRRDPLAVYDRYRGGDRGRIERSASEERMEQVREFDGEQAYEKMMQTMEEARQEKARQAEKGQGKWRGQGWSGLGKRRQGAGSAVGRNAADRSGTLAPAAEVFLPLWIRACFYVAQLVVAPAPGGPNAEAWHPAQPVPRPAAHSRTPPPDVRPLPDLRPPTPVPADDAVLSATTQALDDQGTPRLFPGNHLWTGTTGKRGKDAGCRHRAPRSLL